MIDTGAYLLVIRLNKNATIQVGALGKILFNKGHYVYVGSAMNSLSKRIDRHIRKEKKIKWHINYLLANKNTKIIQVLEFPSKSKLECSLSKKIKDLTDSGIKDFGCSDCRCSSHLFFFAHVPSFQLTR